MVRQVGDWYFKVKRVGCLLISGSSNLVVVTLQVICAYVGHLVVVEVNTDY